MYNIYIYNSYGHFSFEKQDIQRMRENVSKHLFYYMGKKNNKFSDMGF